MKKRSVFILAIFMVFTFLTGCSTEINDGDKKEIKSVIDNVLTNEGYYTGDITKYVGEDTYYNSNYVIFYSYFLGQAKLSKYESELKSVEKVGSKYTAYMVINMEAVPTVSGNGEELSSVELSDSAEGENVPVQVTLKKNGKSFYIEDTKEYDSLDEAIKTNKGFEG